MKEWIAVLVFLTCTLFAVLPGSAEVTIGIGGGILFSGEQDLKLKQFDSAGGSIETEQNSFRPRPSFIDGLTLTYWGDGDKLPSWLGIELSLLRWDMSGKSRFGTIKEERTGLFLSALGRYPSDSSKKFFYGGIGLGEIASSVTSQGIQTNRNTDLGASMVAGVAIPIAQSVRLRIETRLIVTHDVDVRGGKSGSYIETSGTPSTLHSPHWDTIFFPVMAVLEYKFW